MPFPDNKLFLTSALRKYGIRFQDLRMGQDLNFYFRFLGLCDKVAVLPEPVCQYRVVSGSISHSNDDRLLELAKGMFDARDFALAHDTTEYYRVHLANAAIVHLSRTILRHMEMSDPIERKRLIRTIYRQAKELADGVGWQMSVEGQKAMDLIECVYARRFFYERHAYTWYRRLKKR